MGLFDRKIIRVAGANKRELPGFLSEARIVENDPVLCENPHFKESLKEIQEGVTFYGHAKGVSREVNNPLKWWVEQLYRGNLDTPPDLETYLVSGCFGKLRVGSKNVPMPWHYSGSFFWFTQEVLDRYRTRTVPINIDSRWFTENFCGWLVDQQEAEFRLHVSAEIGYNCYADYFWQRHPHLKPGKP